MPSLTRFLRENEKAALSRREFVDEIPELIDQIARSAKAADLT
jgi:hypothetical protein